MVISSIDLKGGHVVQLKNGKDPVIERDDSDSLINDFNKYGEVAVIDLDAALGNTNPKGDTVNTPLLKKLLRKGNVRTGGGVRSVKIKYRLLNGFSFSKTRKRINFIRCRKSYHWFCCLEKRYSSR